jgi:superfamily I DNA and/or RNA helicase
VLAGDQHQLGPVVTGGPVAEATLGSTIFERLANAPEPEWPTGAAGRSGPAIMLEQQHRVHVEIMTFPSRTMYDGRLVAAPAVAAHRLDSEARRHSGPLRPRPLG